jgi:hypothetical protein
MLNLIELIRPVAQPLKRKGKEPAMVIALFQFFFLIAFSLSQITLFLQAITSNPPKIKLCGFVEVNRGLMASVRT